MPKAVSGERDTARFRSRISYAGMTRIRFVGYVSQPRGTPSGFRLNYIPGARENQIP